MAFLHWVGFAVAPALALGIAAASAAPVTTPAKPVIIGTTIKGPLVVTPRGSAPKAAVRSPAKALLLVAPGQAASPASPPVKHVSPPVRAYGADTSAPDQAGGKICARELAATETSLRKTLLRVAAAENAGASERCTAFREHAEIATKAREVFSRCATGRDRDIDVEQMDNALLKAKLVLSRTCTGTQASATPAETKTQP